MGRPQAASALSARRTAFIVVALLAASGLAQIAAAPAVSEQAGSEQRAAQALDAVRGDPLALHVFLKRMPKGADLHNHLDGAVYAETFIRVGGEDGLCVDPVAKAFTKSQPIKSGAEPKPVCEAGDVPAAEVPKNQRLYDELVDSFSMRGFVPSKGETEHDHFFGTFAKFGGTDPRHTGEFLHEVTARAAPKMSPRPTPFGMRPKPCAERAGDAAKRTRLRVLRSLSRRRRKGGPAMGA